MSTAEIITFAGAGSAKTKRILLGHNETGITAYAIITRESDGYLLNDVGDVFASAPADPYFALAEHATIKGRYSADVSTSVVWTNGWYTVTAYKQAGGSPAPAEMESLAAAWAFFTAANSLAALALAAASAFSAAAVSPVSSMAPTFLSCST